MNKSVPQGCLVAFGMFAGVIVAWFWLNFYDVPVRYRLTLEVQDGDQLKTASSVIDVSYNIEPDWSPGQPWSSPVPVGYSPTVNLGEKGLLFLTFLSVVRTPQQQGAFNQTVSCVTNDIGCLPFAAYHLPDRGTIFSQKKAALDELLRQTGPREVPFVVLPQLVRFNAADDRHRYVSVSPDDLASAFGPGVELKRVTLELTDAPVTPLPEIWPQWLKEKRQMAGVLKGYHND